MERKYYNQLDATNPLGRHIVDVDCIYNGGRFILRSLPTNLPSLFTIRFTAPADYTQGDVIVVDGKELPVRTPGMVNASTGLYMAGAVMHCDIDLDRELAFFWQNGAGAPGVLPNRSFSEQFAGFYDEYGYKVYFRTVDYGGMLSSTTWRRVHGIPNIRRFLDQKICATKDGAIADHTVCYWHGATNHIFVHSQKTEAYIMTGGDWSGWNLLVTHYYTCTDR